jgi:GTPase SAR1 family protein/predicted  nucleic acid-binding Zn-ribbon protein
MDIISYVFIAVAAIASGLGVYLIMRFTHKSKYQTKLDGEKVLDVIVSDANPSVLIEEQSIVSNELTKCKNQLIKAKEEISELESKLQKALDSKSSISKDLVQCREQLLTTQQQLADSLVGKIDEQQIAQITDASPLQEKIAKLEKQIKNYEDEIEDYEDDIDKLKKNLRTAREEVESLDEQYRNSKKKNLELEENILSKTKELTSTQQELSIKQESLSFVQEVLQAEKASDGRQLETAIDRFVDFIRGDFADALKDIDKSRIDESGLLSWSLSAKKTWLRNKTTIAFVGEFSAGKTSIVNRILSQDNKDIPLLPVSAKATTAIPTYISGGIATAYQFYSPDNILKSISEITFKKITKEVLDQVEGLSSLITYFVMKYKNPNLDKLSILDTPGFNSNDSEDSRRTIDVINECDALFWVFDVNAGTVNRSSLQIIKEHLRKPLYIVINKVDTKSDTEVDAVEALIKKTIAAEDVSVQQYIRFSANPKYDLESIMEPIRTVQRDVSHDEFIDVCEHKLNDLYSKLKTALQNVTEAYNDVRVKHDGVVDQYVNTQNQLYKSCERALSIPHFESHFFRQDNYEMSQEEFTQLNNILEDVAIAKCNRLAKLFDTSNEIMDEMHGSYNKVIETQQALSKLNDIIQKFNKYKKAYQSALM